jgi:hypothetical protein
MRRRGSNGDDEKYEKEGSGWARLTSAQGSRVRFCHRGCELHREGCGR